MGEEERSTQYHHPVRTDSRNQRRIPHVCVLRIRERTPIVPFSFFLPLHIPENGGGAVATSAGLIILVVLGGAIVVGEAMVFSSLYDGGRWVVGMFFLKWSFG